MTGNDNAKFDDGGTEYKINVIMDKFDRKNLNDIRSMTFMSNDGRQVELKEFANVYEKELLT